MSWRDLETAGLTHSPSPLDTHRFGISVGRVSIGDATTSTLQVAEALKRSLASDEEVLVVRYPPALTDVPALLAASGRTILVADSLVYWGAEPQAVVEATVSLVAQAGDMDIGHGPVESASLAEAVVATFDEYPNHYAVNPRFPQDGALAGYVEWALRKASADADGLVVLRHEERLMGFATWTCDAEVAEIELAGLVPSARGRGHYALLLAEVARLSLLEGVARLVISTQAGNVRVQRAWHRAGLAPFATFTTLHAVR